MIKGFLVQSDEKLYLHLLVTCTIADCTDVALRKSQAAGVFVCFVCDSGDGHRKVQAIGHVDGQTEILLHVHQWKIDVGEAAVDHCWEEGKDENGVKKDYVKLTKSFLHDQV